MIIDECIDVYYSILNIYIGKFHTMGMLIMVIVWTSIICSDFIRDILFFQPSCRRLGDICNDGSNRLCCFVCNYNVCIFPDDPMSSRLQIVGDRTTFPIATPSAGRSQNSFTMWDNLWLHAFKDNQIIECSCMENLSKVDTA